MPQEFDYIYWNELKMKLKQRYSELNNSDLSYRDGMDLDEMLKEIAVKLGITWRQMSDIILQMQSS